MVVNIPMSRLYLTQPRTEQAYDRTSTPPFRGASFGPNPVAASVRGALEGRSRGVLKKLLCIPTRVRASGETVSSDMLVPLAAALSSPTSMASNSSRSLLAASVSSTPRDASPALVTSSSASSSAVGSSLAARLRATVPHCAREVCVVIVPIPISNCCRDGSHMA